MTERIEINPKIMFGKPVIRGTRITVEILLRKLAHNLSAEAVLKDYPQISLDDIKAAVDYAASTLRDEEVYSLAQNRS